MYVASRSAYILRFMRVCIQSEQDHVQAAPILHITSRYIPRDMRHYICAMNCKSLGELRTRELDLHTVMDKEHGIYDAQFRSMRL